MQDYNPNQEDGYFDVVATLEGGTMIPELDQQMRELVRLVKARGGTGTMTLKLSFKEGDYEGTMGVLPTLTVAPPAKRRQSNLLFTNDQNGLTLDKPVQTPLFRTSSVAEGADS